MILYDYRLMCLLDVRSAMKDLILFPGDATFQKVEQSAWGRTYVLKFSSSDQRHFVRVHTMCYCAMLTFL